MQNNNNLFNFFEESMSMVHNSIVKACQKKPVITIEDKMQKRSDFLLDFGMTENDVFLDTENNEYILVSDEYEINEFTGNAKKVFIPNELRI